MNLPTPLTDPNAYPIIGESEAMREVWRQVAQVAPTNATVLITVSYTHLTLPTTPYV